MKIKSRNVRHNLREYGSEKELILVSEAEAERPGARFGAHPRDPGLGFPGLGTAKSGQVPTSTDKSRQIPKDLEKEGTMADRAASLDNFNSGRPP